MRSSRLSPQFQMLAGPCLFWAPACSGPLPVLKPGQVIVLTPSDMELTLGEDFTLDVEYVLDNPGAAIPPALLVEVHYDSSRIKFDDVTFTLADGLVNHIESESPEVEAVPDGDLRTDRTMIFAWSDFLGAWPAGSTTHVKLATIQFQPEDVTAKTLIRATGLASAGFIFDPSESPLIDLVGNRPLTFNASNPPVVNEDSGPAQVVNWATDIDAGEADQAVTSFVVSDVSNPALFATPPAVSVDGTLTYTPATNAFGTSTFSVVAVDDGGSLGTGSAQSFARTFRITVEPVNDRPTVTLGNVTPVESDAGAQSLPGFIQSSTTGPANESDQSITGFELTVNDPSLFAVLPAINLAGTLSFTPASDSSGTATVTVVARDDGGTARGGLDTSIPQSFTLRLIDPPTITTQPNGLSLEIGEAGSLSVAASSADPLSYQWFVNGELIVGATQATFEIPEAYDYHTGSYSVLVSSATGSVMSDEVTVSVNPRNSLFNFIYDVSGTIGFNDPVDGAAFKQALELTGQRLTNLLFHFNEPPITLDVFVQSSEANQPSASAGSEPEDFSFDTFIGAVGRKLRFGIDINGDDPDANLEVVFPDSTSSFVFSAQTVLDPVSTTDVDFKSIMMHELIHTLNFSSNIFPNGSSDGESEGITSAGFWTPFDLFLGDLQGNRLIDSETLLMDIDLFNQISTGGPDPVDPPAPGIDPPVNPIDSTGGVYFHGPNAVAANGGNPVAIFSPSTFLPGSSLEHLDISFDSLMRYDIQPGSAPQLPNALELAILRDLGFIVPDSTGPTITVGPTTLEATGPDGISASAVEITATDDSGLEPFVVFQMPPANMLPLGSTEIGIVAFDPFLNTSLQPATIIVRDTTPPSLNVEPTSLNFTIGSVPADVLALITATATDIVDGSVDISSSVAGDFGVGTTTITYTALDDSGNQSQQQVVVTVTDQERDYGDAPADYPVTIANNGASHPIGALFLGAGVDAEADGTPSATANADSLDDGVMFVSTLFVDSTTASRSSVAVTSSLAGKLDAWIDFNGDGDWDDTGEQIALNFDVTEGENLIVFDVPNGASFGMTAARFRVSSSGGLAPTGQAADGEVEDYLVDIVDGDSTAGLTIQVIGGSIILLLDNDDNVIRSGGTEIFRYLAQNIDSLDINGTATDDTIIIDFSSGLTLPSGGLQINGGGGTNTLEIIGERAALDLTDPNVDVMEVSQIQLPAATPNTITVDAAAIRRLNPTGQTITVTAGANDSVDVIDAYQFRLMQPISINGAFTQVAQHQTTGEMIQLTSPRPYRNFLQVGDVNNSGGTTASDALAVIFELNTAQLSDGSGNLVDASTVANWPGIYLDANGDGRVSAADALQVINILFLQSIDDLLGESVDTQSLDWSKPISELDLTDSTSVAEGERLTVSNEANLTVQARTTAAALALVVPDINMAENDESENEARDRELAVDWLLSKEDWF